MELRLVFRVRVRVRVKVRVGVTLIGYDISLRIISLSFY